VRLRSLWLVSPAIVLGLAFFALTRVLRRSPTIPHELSVDRVLTNRAPASLIDLSHAVDVQHWMFVVLALVLLLLLARRFRQGLLLLLAEPLAESANLALKLAINRQPPGQGPVAGLDRLDVLLFPSGHVTRTTVTLGLLVLFVAWPHARVRIPALLAALGLLALIGVTQVSVGGHLPLDVLGGYLLGGMLVNVIYVVDLRLRAGRRSVEAGALDARPPTPGRARLPRGLVAGAAVLLVVAALGLRVPQRLVHLATQPTTAGQAKSILHSLSSQWRLLRG
jgi:membrane-associated phospholipid phosphatase